MPTQVARSIAETWKRMGKARDPLDAELLREIPAGLRELYSVSNGMSSPDPQDFEFLPVEEWEKIQLGGVLAVVFADYLISSFQLGITASDQGEDVVVVIFGPSDFAVVGSCSAFLDAYDQDPELLLTAVLNAPAGRPLP